MNNVADRRCDVWLLRDDWWGRRCGPIAKRCQRRSYAYDQHADHRPRSVRVALSVRLWRFALRQGSGGVGRHCGGEGLVREIEFLKPLSLSLITNRRGTHQPWGLAGGGSGAAGQNVLTRVSGRTEALAAAASVESTARRPFNHRYSGGGGFGTPVT